MQRKKITPRLLALFLTLALSACGKKTEQPPQPTPTPATQPSPTGEPAQPSLTEEPEPTETPAQTGSGLIDFTSAGHSDAFEIDEAAHTVTLKKVGGDHMAVFNGLEAPSIAFVFEADVTFPDGPDSGVKSAALTFGLQDKNNPFARWYGANLDSNRINESNLFRVFSVGASSVVDTGDGGEKGGIDIDAPLHLKLEMQENGKYTYSFGNAGDAELRSFTGRIPDWAGGYVGILAWESTAAFSNISFENKAFANAAQIDFNLPEEGDDNPVQTGLIDFSSSMADLIEVDKEAGTVTVGNSHGDHFVVYDGLDAPIDSFIFEADVELLEANESGGGISGALVFGMETRDVPNWKWYGANFDTGRSDPTKFRVFGPGFETGKDGEQGDIDFTQPLHLCLEVRRSGAYKYSFGNVGQELTRSLTGMITNWEGGHIGILSFNSKVRFSNITLKNRSVASAGEDTVAAISGDGFVTNLSDLAAYGGVWTVNEDGLAADTAGSGNCFAYSRTNGTDFVFSTDVTFLSEDGTAALIFRNPSTSNHSNAFALSLDAGAGSARFMRWENDRKVQLVGDKMVGNDNDRKYTLKVVAVGSWMSCYVNDVLIASTGDYVLGFNGQNTVPENGYFGLQCANGNVVFQNTNYTEITNDNSPLLQDITVSSSGGVEKKAQFVSTIPVLIQYVKNDAARVDLDVAAIGSDAVITVTGPDGAVYEGGKDIPVNEGTNYVSINSVTTAPDGISIPVTYRVNVFRRQADDIYYNEPYRGQYHYSVQDGWVNDPNGLVYYNGTYHLFYQFATTTVWSTMHWAHATSPDLVHWEDHPIAFMPNANGTAFSGCIVADITNTSGLFSTNKGGLVALITADGNGQRLQLAYSEDEGATWTRRNQIVLDWSNDPLHDQAFRDPKVFRWEGKWFLVIAGGPLRIYSSENLIDWTVESTYPGLHTECPDLYPIEASDGVIKWVLSRGGRFYKIGDFKEVDGKWAFVPDEAYADADGVMNFGRDSYAAMTYYIQDFGTAANPAIPEIIEINWMNTWDYCNEVANTVGQKFNGTFNLNLKLGVTVENGRYVLTQNPVAAYESLRGEAAVDLKGVEADPENDLLAGFSGDCYEVVATFKPGENTEKVGFKLRAGGDKYTEVSYNVATGVLFVDRGKSGIQVGNFADGGHQAVSLNPDGTIDLHIFLDRGSIEVFAKGGIAAGGNQLFPAADSLGASVIVEGDPVTADITIYHLNSIWH